jgi:7-cyano-7-deazaguanine synthase
MPNKNALVLLSGGQDSTTCLFWAVREFEQVYAIGFDYGQRHYSELTAASGLAAMARVPFSVYKIDTFSSVSGNALTNHEIEIESSKTEGLPPNTLVEGRNLLFLTYAAIYAKQVNTDNLIIGAGQTDYSGYPDCRNEFILSVNSTINLALDHEFVIHAPLMWKTKAQTWAMADELGVFETVHKHTVTCYKGIRGEGCGACPSCRLRMKGLEEYQSQKSTAKHIF